MVAMGASTFDSQNLHIYDLVQLGFYFCLRSCEYTKSTTYSRTVQFQALLEFVVFVRDQLLPAAAPI